MPAIASADIRPAVPLAPVRERRSEPKMDRVEEASTRGSAFARLYTGAGTMEVGHVH